MRLHQKVAIAKHITHPTVSSVSMLRLTHITSSFPTAQSPPPNPPSDRLWRRPVTLPLPETVPTSQRRRRQWRRRRRSVKGETAAGSRRSVPAPSVSGAHRALRLRQARRQRLREEIERGVECRSSGSSRGRTQADLASQHGE